MDGSQSRLNSIKLRPDHQGHPTDKARSPSGKFRCTLDPGHHGPYHIAESLTNVVAVWPVEEN